MINKELFARLEIALDMIYEISETEFYDDFLEQLPNSVQQYLDNIGFVYKDLQNQKISLMEK